MLLAQIRSKWIFATCVAALCPTGPPALFAPSVEVPVWYWYWHWSDADQGWYWHWTWYFERRDVCHLDCWRLHRRGPTFGA